MRKFGHKRYELSYNMFVSKGKTEVLVFQIFIWAFLCGRVRVQTASAILWAHKPDPAELFESSGQQEVEKKILEMESPQSA